jgi:hypothetical protein
MYLPDTSGQINDRPEPPTPLTIIAFVLVMIVTITLCLIYRAAGG